MVGKLISKIKALLPEVSFFTGVIAKAVSMLVSLKYQLIVVASVFLIIGTINQDNWVKVVIAIATGNVAIHLVDKYTRKDDSSSNTPPSS